jgi:drug/metabolite transporter (DMT)-like permease
MFHRFDHCFGAIGDRQTASVTCAAARAGGKISRTGGPCKCLWSHEIENRSQKPFPSAGRSTIFRGHENRGGGLTERSAGAGVPVAKLAAAFAAVYVIWGSTYLAIRFAIETMPPFLMAGTRFVVAGGLLYVWAVVRGAARPHGAHWLTAVVIGTLLLMGGNGAVTWSEQRIPSGVAALLIAITPCWMVLLDWLRPGGVRPTAQVVVGLMLGLGGIALLVGPESLLGGSRVDPVGALVLVVGSMCWATGSIYSRHASVPASPSLAVGMQMLCGGAVLLVVGALAGDFSRLDVSAVSLRSGLAFVYLILFGAIVGYSAYIWLLRSTTPARVSTYAYVNPVVAVLLGSALGGESIALRMLVAALVIVGGVALITLAPTGPRRAQSGPARAAPAARVR